MADGCDCGRAIFDGLGLVASSAARLGADVGRAIFLIGARATEEGREVGFGLGFLPEKSPGLGLPHEEGYGGAIAARLLRSLPPPSFSSSLLLAPRVWG